MDTRNKDQPLRGLCKQFWAFEEGAGHGQNTAAHKLAQDSLCLELPKA